MRTLERSSDTVKQTATRKQENQISMCSQYGLIFWTLSHSPHICLEKEKGMCIAPYGTWSSSRAPQKSFIINKKRSAIKEYRGLQITLFALECSFLSSARAKVELSWTQYVCRGKGQGLLNYLADSSETLVRRIQALNWLNSNLSHLPSASLCFPAFNRESLCNSFHK